MQTFKDKDLDTILLKLDGGPNYVSLGVQRSAEVYMTIELDAETAVKVAKAILDAVAGMADSNRESVAELFNGPEGDFTEVEFEKLTDLLMVLTSALQANNIGAHIDTGSVEREISRLLDRASDG